MSDSFQDRLRRSAGLATTAEREAIVHRQRQYEDQWKLNEPLRRRAMEAFHQTVNPLIQERLNEAIAIANEAQIDLVEISIHNMTREILIQRGFTFQGGMNFTRRYPSLYFTLHYTGQLAIEPLEAQDFPNVQPSGISVFDVKPDQIEEGFIALLGAARFH